MNSPGSRFRAEEFMRGGAFFAICQRLTVNCMNGSAFYMEGLSQLSLREVQLSSTILSTQIIYCVRDDVTRPITGDI